MTTNSNANISRRTPSASSSCKYCQQQCASDHTIKLTYPSQPIHNSQGMKARTKRSRPSYKYSALHAAAALLLHAQAAIHVHASSPSTHKLCMPRRTLCAFVSKSCDELKRSTQHGELESACGFRDTHSLYNTKMETDLDTEGSYGLKRARLTKSITYRPITSRGTNGIHGLKGMKGDDNAAERTSTMEIQPMEPTEDTYLTLMKEKDVKIQLTRAINKVLNVDSIKKKNGHSVAMEEHVVSKTMPPTKKLTIRNLWKRRHARSIEEGIRRERIQPVTTEQQLSMFLDETAPSGDGKEDGKGPKKPKKGRYAARTIAGLISALAEEATGLEVEVDSRNDTPFWDKQIDAVKINFSRLGVKALRMGGLDEVLNDIGEHLLPHEKESMADSLEEQAKEVYEATGLGDGPVAHNSTDEIFDRIDVDNSGTLDVKELARALSIASGLKVDDDGEKSAVVLSTLASRLISIYDTNGDGVVDREEYRKLVRDMAAVRDAQKTKQREREEKRQERLERKGGIHPLKWVRMAGSIIHRWTSNYSQVASSEDMEETSVKPIETDAKVEKENFSRSTNSQVDFEGAQDISNDPSIINSISNGEGSIVLSDLKLDLRRLLFGAVPLVKHITPGGPLILEPFTMTLKCSFTTEDMLESALLDDGLRRLVARALRRRVRSLRDLLDGAVLSGRTWNTASKQAPVVEVPKLLNIEFDTKNRIIITGRAKIRTSPDQPFVENSFKLRTRLGTREDGRFIRLEEPELALVLECPKAWERNIVSACKNFNIPVPKRPEPLYKFIPLVSPIKKTEQDGFNLGDDNRIKSIFVKDGALRFEMSLVLRPGRFLGNHYLAMTVPNRTFIITMDRIKEGFRTARQNKRELERSKREFVLNKKQQASDRYNMAVAQALSSSTDVGTSGDDTNLSYNKVFEEEDLSFAEPKQEESKESTEEADIVAKPGFLGRFLEGYLEAAREETEKERNERLTTAISEFFSPDDDAIENQI